MSKTYTRTLLKEDWSAFPLGEIRRDCTARGEYMAMVVPANPGGWYHNCRAGVGKDRDHSTIAVRGGSAGRRIGLATKTPTWGSAQVVLTPGERPWRDYRVSCLVAAKGLLPVGLVGRYQTNRDYYAAVFEGGMFKLLCMLEGHPTVLAETPMKPPARPVKVTLTFDGDRLTAAAGRTKLAARDGSLAAGGIGLWLNGAGSFGTVTVQAPAAEVARIARETKRSTTRITKKRKALPPMKLMADVDVSGHALGRQLRLADLDGDGRCELIFAVPTFHQGRKWRYNKIRRLSALNLDGEVLWQRGRFSPNIGDITADLPFQAADRGEGMEVVAAFGPSLHIIDPLTGETKRKSATPKTSPMEPYWDEISQYWGDGHHDDVPRLIPDCIRLCNFTGRADHGDIFVKDRYHNAWALDGRTFKIIWHHCCNTGHYPYAADLNGDGRDEMLLGYSRVDSKGKLIGRLFLGDHPDACFSYVDSRGARHSLHPCGEAGFIDAASDGRFGELHLGHVQHISLGNFRADRPDLERVVVTYHGNEGIIALLDSDNRIVRKAERYAAGAVCQPVNWTGDGRELIAFSARHGDGGLWDDGFDLVAPFPTDDRPGKYMEVHDVLGLGVDQVIVWDESRLHVYAPAELPARKGKRYAPLKPDANLSNYQVNYSIPRWI